MPLVIEDRNSFLIVAGAVDANNAADWFIWLQEITVFRDSTFMEEGLSRWSLGAVVINNQRQPWN